MYRNKSIAVVVPCYNEESQISKVIQTMPAFVDFVFIVDDHSVDQTRKKALEAIELSSLPGRYKIIRHFSNRGVGAALRTGYLKSLEQKVDITAVMAGDGQMDPNDLHRLLDVIIDGKADYAKGDRLTTGDAWRNIPKIRYIGNSILSLLTKIASGYWHIADSQTGYTAITYEALNTIQIKRLYKRYGYPNHLLILLSVYNFKVADVPIRPVYNIGEKSGIKISKVVFTISWLLIKQFFWRIKEKYIIRDFHPLVICYAQALLLLAVAAFLGCRIFLIWCQLRSIPAMNSIAFLFSSILGSQFLFFATWMDMEYSKGPKRIRTQNEQETLIYQKS